MGVMTCSRGDCQNIMCGRLILDGSAYICDACYDELIMYRETWTEREMLVSEVRERIKSFMRTPTRTYITVDATGIENEFRRLTGER